MLKGFRIGFNNGDHHVLTWEIDLDVVRIVNNSVTVADTAASPQS